MFNRYQQHTTSHEIWVQMNADYEQTNEHIVSLLLDQLQGLKCPSIYKLISFLDKIVEIRNELNARNKTLEDKHYKRAIVVHQIHVLIQHEK